MYGVKPSQATKMQVSSAVRIVIGAKFGPSRGELARLLGNGAQCTLSV